MAAENRGWFYVKVPDASEPRAQDIYELRVLPMPVVEEGMILVKKTMIVVAPMARTYLEIPNFDTKTEKLGLKKTQLNQPGKCESVGIVMESKSKKYKLGDRVLLPFNDLLEYSVHRDDGKDSEFGPPLKVFDFVRTETQLTALSPGAGLTAYCAMNHPCGRVEEPLCSGGLLSCFKGLFQKKPQKTVLITSAAGAVGTIAGQLYKRKGCKVIGVTGTREKADQLLNFGYDAAIAYKTEDMDQQLAQLAPEGIDVFMDNVGSHQLDIGTKHMNVSGKVVIVGCMSEVDRFGHEVHGYKGYLHVAARELTVGGFLVYNHVKEIPLAIMSMAWMLQSGAVKPAATVVEGSFEGWAKTVDAMMSGATFGRLLLNLAKS
ncbi:Ptgr1 [Symbiodinium natans]|uniref:Ptgr1 protein n=1 Tax=Symbiodinium natans TaxID=878477 RepID=A0A812P9J2_9DINO|nr:Ptgr1 [Symbiodinium natans]